MPEVNIIEPTPIFENSSIASPGLKHHQLRVLDVLPAQPKKKKYTDSTGVNGFRHTICIYTQISKWVVVGWASIQLYMNRHKKTH